jgi:hypothetical protein
VVEILVRVAEDEEAAVLAVGQQVEQRQPPHRVDVLGLVDHDRVASPSRGSLAGGFVSQATLR